MKRKLVTLKLPAGDTAVCAHESVYAGDALIGRVTSGGYSYHFRHDIAMALVAPDYAVAGSALRVHVHNEMRDAVVVGGCLYDPENARARM